MIAMLLTFAFAGLIWGLALALRATLLAACLAYLMVAACFGYGFWSYDLGPLPLTVDRIVLALLAGTYLVHRRLGRTEPKPIERVDWLLFGLLVCLTASTLTHDFHLTYAGAVPPLWRLLAGYLGPALVYWIARQARITERGISLFQGTLLALGVYLAVTGMLEIAQQWWLVFPKHIGDSRLGIHFGRARGPMLSSVTFGLYLSICLFAAWVYLGQRGRKAKLLLAALLPLYLAGVYVSYTRSVWMGAAAGLLIVLVLSLEARMRWAVLPWLVGAGLFLGLTKFDRIVSLDRESTASESRDSTAMRASFAYVSWQMFQQRPLLGFGFGQFVRAKWPFLSDRASELKLEPIRHLVHHNTLLSLLTETGAVGLALFLAVMAGWTRAAWRLARSSTAPAWARRQGVLFLAALGAYLPQLLFHELSYSPIDNSLLFFMAGTVMGLSPAAENGPALSPLQTAWHEAPGLPGGLAPCALPC